MPIALNGKLKQDLSYLKTIDAARTYQAPKSLLHKKVLKVAKPVSDYQKPNIDRFRYSGGPNHTYY